MRVAPGVPRWIRAIYSTELGIVASYGRKRFNLARRNFEGGGVQTADIL